MNETEEKIVQVANGWVRLSFHLLMLVAAIVASLPLKTTESK